MALYDRIKQYLTFPAPQVETQIFVHLVRHGEAYHNLGHFHGQVNLLSYAIPDPVLTDKGTKQAKAARWKMAERCPVPHLVLISPLARTIETALHVFPTNNNGSIASQPQIVAYDDLRESGAYLCNVRQSVTVLADEYSHKGIDVSALSPVIPPMKSVIRTKQRAKIILKEIMSIARILRKGGGIWKGVNLKGPAGWPLCINTKEDIHIVVVSHGSFMRYLLPSSHRIKPVWKPFRASEMRTYIMDANCRLNETVESKEARRTTILRKVSSIFTGASDRSHLLGIDTFG